MEIINKNISLKMNAQNINCGSKRNATEAACSNPVITENKSLEKKLNIPSSAYYSNFALSFSGKAESIGVCGKKILEKMPDGGYLLEKTMGVIGYYGDNALNFFKNKINFELDKQIIVPKGGIVRVTVDEESMTLAKEGAIQIGKGTKASIEIIKGRPEVFTTERAPEWFYQYGPNGNKTATKEMFDRLTNANKHYMFGDVNKQLFKPDVLEKLQESKIVQNSADEKFIKFAKFNDAKELKKALNSAGIENKETIGVLVEWKKSKIRELSGKECGSLSLKNNLKGVSGETVEKLKNEGIITQFLKGVDEDKHFWAKYQTEEELVANLEKASIPKDEQEKILKAWDKTTKSGYDISGLVWEPQSKAPVTVYVRESKIKMNNQERSDWDLNSAAWAGEGKVPFVTGVSRVSYKSPTGKSCDFGALRGDEQFHMHPNDPNVGHQTEIYYGKTQNPAVLANTPNNELNFSVLGQDDLVIIEPGVTHKVTAIGGDSAYSHTLAQCPSMFQGQTYKGQSFKMEQKTENYGVTNEQLLEKGLETVKEAVGEK